MLRVKSIIKISLFLFIIATFTTCRNVTSPPPRILVFGIDAATWKILDPLLERGALPTIQSILSRGVKANLKTLKPTVSVALWTTIATGELPSKHGIRSWLTDQNDKKGQLGVSSNLRRVPTYWEIASQNDQTVLVVNWWATWPAEKVNGILVSNWMHFSDEEKLVYPPELTPELRAIPFASKHKIQDMLTSLNPLKREIKLTQFGFRTIQRDIYYLDIAEHLLRKQSFDIASIYTRGIDILEHKFLTDSPVFSPSEELRKKAQGIIEAHYSWLDRRLKKLMDLCGDNLTVIIVSDHGMEPVTGPPPNAIRFKMNDFLAKLNIIPTTDQGKPDKSHAVVLNNEGYPPGLTFGLRFFPDRLPPNISPDEYIQSLIKKLKQVKLDGKPLFEFIEIHPEDDSRIYLRMHPYSFSPEMKISSDGQNFLFSDVLLFSIFPYCGQHWDAPDGIVALAGPSIRHIPNRIDIKIEDIAPTILALAGLPIAKDLEGKPRLDILQEDTSIRQSVQWVDSFGTPRPESIPIPSKFDEQTKKELRVLGYIQ